MAAEYHHTTERIAALRSSPIATALAQVMAMVLQRPMQIVTTEPLSNTVLLGNGVLILRHIAGRSDVPRLIELRRHGFVGPVIVASDKPFESLLTQYRILRGGQGSHAALTPPFSIGDLLRLSVSLSPLEPENLRDLQQELAADGPAIAKMIETLLQRLDRSSVARDAVLMALNEHVDRLRILTPVACHSRITLRGECLQIQEHFRRLLQDLEMHPDNLADLIRAFRQVVTEWRVLVTFGTNEAVAAGN